MAKRRRRRKKGKMKALIAVEAAVMLALIVVLFVIWKLDLADTGNKKSVIEATLNDEVQAQIEALEKESEKYAPPINPKFGQGAVRGAAQMGHLIYEGSVEKGWPYAVAGALGAAFAGQAGPQALLPEEIITVPAGAALGMAAGSTMNIFESWLSISSVFMPLFTLSQ